jgi:hypothetical protein
VVEVSLAIMGLKDLGSEMEEKTAVPPYLGEVAESEGKTGRQQYQRQTPKRIDKEMIGFSKDTA